MMIQQKIPRSPMPSSFAAADARRVPELTRRASDWAA
jgi:hypothetical protein